MSDILALVVEVSQSIRHRGLMLNERCLHHYFSHLLQARYGLLDLKADNVQIALHPEWPTYKKQTGLLYGRYREEDGKYKPDPNGRAGFIDFAFGQYEKPEIGIELSLKYGWSHEEIVYDFLKLLDNKNPFKTAISFNVIFREKGLVRGESLKDLEDHMNDAFKEAVRRLGRDVCDNSRELHLIVTEVAKDNSRRHWHYDRARRRFGRGLPFPITISHQLL